MVSVQQTEWKNCCKLRACLFVAGLYGMRFDGNRNSFLKKWKLMDTDTHKIDYENMLK